MNRIVCNFSCGAASAVATRLTLIDHSDREVVIVNAFIEEEHPDNRRFLKDCEGWFGREVLQLCDEKYGASALGVFRKKRFITGLGGAPCSKALKREVLAPYNLPTDTIVLGYPAEEPHRLDRFLDANNGVSVMTPLIDRGLKKADCLAIIERAGIALPAMYALGYQNNNCIGCVKGGMGYWNKIRRDFPERFDEMADLQEAIGPKAAFLKLNENGVKNSRYIMLRELPPDLGRYQDEPSISCGLFCEAAANDIGEGSMTHSGGQSHAIGDEGQRYQVSCCFTVDGARQIFGWVESLAGAARMVRSIDLHPTWHEPEVLDRETGELVPLETVKGVTP